MRFFPAETSPRFDEYLRRNGGQAVKTHIAVIGTVFVDCKGFAAARYVPTGRNIGSVRFVHGGVGRNVAENLGHLGLSVSLVSSVDKGAIGADVVGRLGVAGVDTSYIATLDECGMGMWLAVLDEWGDLAGSISQMPNLQGLTDTLSDRGGEIMEKASHVALELDLNEAITKQALALAREKQRPVFGLPGNLEVIAKFPEVLDGLECFICNHIEAGRLLGMDFPEADPQKVLEKLPAFTRLHNLRSIVVTLGAQGCVFFDAVAGDSGVQPALAVEVVDTCGAGDAFFSGALFGRVRGLPLSAAVLAGTRAAACTIQSAENSCPALGDQMTDFRKPRLTPSLWRQR